MIVSIIGSILGFGTTLLPKVMDYFERKQEIAREIEVAKIQMQAAAQGHEFKIKEINVQADISETTNLYRHDESLNGGKLINAFKSSVRPVITYGFFLLFVAIKVCAVWIMLYDQNIPITQALPVIWDDETAALFGAIMGFWFGDRNIQRNKAAKAAKGK